MWVILYNICVLSEEPMIECLLITSITTWTDYCIHIHCYVRGKYMYVHVITFSFSHPVTKVLDFLKSQGLEEHATSFEENQVDGEILSSIIAHENVDEILQGLGVTKALHLRKIKLRFKFCDSASVHSNKAD